MTLSEFAHLHDTAIRLGIIVLLLTILSWL